MAVVARRGDSTEGGADDDRPQPVAFEVDLQCKLEDRLTDDECMRRVDHGVVVFALARAVGVIESDLEFRRGRS